jgi:hypothetical protein
MIKIQAKSEISAMETVAEGTITERTIGYRAGRSLNVCVPVFLFRTLIPTILIEESTRCECTHLVTV